MNKFEELRKIDVKKYIEKKGKFNYLSWAWAVDQLLSQDPMATWIYQEPSVYTDGTMMVYCNLYAFGKKIRMHLPVLSGNNQPISEPNAFQVNTAMMRCLTKAISCTGIGLIQLYANEDLPLDEDGIEELLERISSASNMQELQQVYAELAAPAKAKKK